MSPPAWAYSLATSLAFWVFLASCWWASHHPRAAFTYGAVITVAGLGVLSVRLLRWADEAADQ